VKGPKRQEETEVKEARRKGIVGGRGRGQRGRNRKVA
jgi:hypothetical protein